MEGDKIGTSKRALATSNQQAVDISKAVSLGLPNDVCIKAIIRDYVEQHLSPEAVAKKAKTA